MVRPEGGGGGNPHLVPEFENHDVTGGTIVGQGEDISAKAGDVENFNADLTTSHNKATSGVAGTLTSILEGADTQTKNVGRQLVQRLVSGGASVRWFGDRVTEFDSQVDGWNGQIFAEKKKEDQQRVRSGLVGQYNSAVQSLETSATTTSNRLRKPLDAATINALWAAGAMPSTVAPAFNDITDLTRIPMTALPTDLQDLTDEELRDYALEHPEQAAILVGALPDPVKELIGQELAERGRNLDPQNPETYDWDLHGYDDFSTLLEAYGTDQVIATSFLTDLGPRGLMELNGKVALTVQSSEDWDGIEEQGPMITRLQHALSDTLAAGTQRPDPAYPGAPIPESNRYVSAEWLGQMMEEGRNKITIDFPQSAGGYPQELYGYQLLSPLLDNENSDPEFVSLVGSDMIDFEQQYAGDNDGRLPWDETLPNAADRLDWRHGTDANDVSGYDPVSGVMQALESNDEAAKQFFTGTETFSSDGNSLNRVDYLMTEREWPPDGVHDSLGRSPSHFGDDDPTGMGLLGDALRTATLENPDERSVRIAESIVEETYREIPSGEDAKKFSEEDILDPSIREDLSHIAGRYMPSVFTAFDSGNPNPAVNSDDEDFFSDARFNPGGDNGEMPMRLFLAELGKDDVGRENLNAYTNAQTLAELNTELNGTTDPQDVAARVGGVSAISADINGAIDFGATSSAAEEALSEDERYNANVDAATSAGSALLGEVAGKVPLGGYVVDQVATALGDSLHQDSTGEINRQVGDIFGSGGEAQANLIRDAIWLNLPEGARPDGVPANADLNNLTPEQQTAYDNWYGSSDWADQVKTLAEGAQNDYSTSVSEAQQQLEAYR